MKNHLAATLISLLSILSARAGEFPLFDLRQAEGLLRSGIQTAALEAQARDQAVVELIEERLCLATLRMKKSEFTLDPERHIGNWLSAQERQIIVSDTTCDKWKVGSEISGKFDGWGFIFDGDIARYVVRLKDKKILSRYFQVQGSGRHQEITGAQYQTTRERLGLEGKTLITVPYAGMVRTAVLAGPLTKDMIAEKIPVTRYFVLVRVENKTLTLDLEKHIRNAWNTHDIALEVPRESYEKAGKMWDTKLSTISFLVKGNLSFLTGRIVKKWTETDARYLEVRTSDGGRYVLPEAMTR